MHVIEAILGPTYQIVIYGKCEQSRDVWNGSSTCVYASKDPINQSTKWVNIDRMVDLSLKFTSIAVTLSAPTPRRCALSLPMSRLHRLSGSVLSLLGRGSCIS